jgi:hypothetical protein
VIATMRERGIGISHESPSYGPADVQAADAVISLGSACSCPGWRLDDPGNLDTEDIGPSTTETERHVRDLLNQQLRPAGTSGARRSV